MPNAFGQQSDDPCPKDTSPKNNKSEYQVYYLGNFIAFDSDGNFLDPGTAPLLSEEFLDFIESTQQPDNGVDSVMPDLQPFQPGGGFGLVLAPEIVEGYDLFNETFNTKTGKMEGGSALQHDSKIITAGETGDLDLGGFLDWLDNKPQSVIPELGSSLPPLPKPQTEDHDTSLDNSNGPKTSSGLPKLPEGTTITTDADGTIIRINPDGTKIVTSPSGWTVTTSPDGQITETQPDGTSTTSYPDGSSKTSYLDGTQITIYPDGTQITTHPDGTKTTTLPDTSSSETTDEKTTSDGPYDSNQSYSIPVVTADYGRQYPAYQFTIVQYSNVCNGEAFYIGNGAFVGATTLSLGGYAPVGNCGFGTVSSYPIQNISIAGSILNDYLDHVGLLSFPPVPNDATGQSSSPKNANTVPETGSEYTMNARIINGKAYPAYQFLIFSAYSGCSESYLGVSPYGWKNSAGQFVVYHVNFDSAGWVKPSPAGCGFGKVSSTSYVEDYSISSSQAADWKNRFGISITNP